MKSSAEILDTQPPCDLEAERCLLGSLITLNKVPTDIGVTASDFYEDVNQIIFDCFKRLSRDGKPFDAIIISDDLKNITVNETNAFERVGGTAYIYKLATAEYPEHAKFYAQIIRDLSQRRKTRFLGEDLIRQTANGQATEDILQFLTERTDAIKSACDSLPERLERITAADLASDNTVVEYLVEGVLVRGQPMVLGGPQKSLKTAVAMDLAISLAAGGYFLGCFRVNEAVKVGFFSGESGLATLAETARRIARSAGINLESLGDSLLVSTTLPKIDNASHLDELERYIVKNSLSVVIIDPAYLSFGGIADRAGNVFAMGEILLAASEMCQRNGTTLIVCHHARKAQFGAQNKAIDLQDLAFAGWSEFARQWILLNRRSSYELGSGHHELDLQFGGSAGHSAHWGLNINEGSNTAAEGRIWDVELLSIADVKDAASEAKESEKRSRALEKLEADTGKVMSVIDEHGPMTKSAIREHCGFSGARITPALDELVQRNILEPCEVKIGNQTTPGKGYRRVAD